MFNPRQLLKCLSRLSFPQVSFSKSYNVCNIKKECAKARKQLINPPKIGKTPLNR